MFLSTLALLLLVIATVILSLNQSSVFPMENFKGHKVWMRRHPHKLDLSHPYRGKKYRRGYGIANVIPNSNGNLLHDEYPYHNFWKYQTGSPAHYIDLNDSPGTLANWYSRDTLRRQGFQGIQVEPISSWSKGMYSLPSWWAHYYNYYD